MAEKKRRTNSGEVETVAFRLWPPYTNRVVEQAQAARISANQLARVATMAMVDSGLLQLSERLGRIEGELVRLRKDFNNALEE